MPKGTSRAEATLNSEKIKPVAIAELCLTEGISQVVSHKKIPLNNFFLKFRGNFLKVFRVDLNAYLGLVLLNQYYSSVV